MRSGPIRGSSKIHLIHPRSIEHGRMPLCRALRCMLVWEIVSERAAKLSPLRTLFGKVINVANKRKKSGDGKRPKGERAESNPYGLSAKHNCPPFGHFSER